MTTLSSIKRKGITARMSKFSNVHLWIIGSLTKQSVRVAFYGGSSTYSEVSDKEFIQTAG